MAKKKVIKRVKKVCECNLNNKKDCLRSTWFILGALTWFLTQYLIYIFKEIIK